MDFINKTTEKIAKELLGKKLLFNYKGFWLGGYIVETEAYIGPEDMACHGYNWKRTPKVESLYKIGGTIYVYMMHSYNMLNIVTREAERPEAVLIRALQPSDYEEIMIKNRAKSNFEITNGPGKLTKALGITREIDGAMINKGSLLINEEESILPKSIITSSRIGIPNKGEWTDKPLRFYVEGNPYVSRIPKKLMKLTNDTWKL